MVLSYAIYYIAQNPEQQARLQREVSHLGLHLSQQNGADDFPAAATPQVIESLSYLQAVINESLRMRPNSTPLPRITPKGKSVSISGVDDIPPGTRVNCFQWFLHRDPALWPEPDKWIPERWLDEETGLLKRAGELPPLWAFVTGPRSCVGAQLTYYCESRLSLRQLTKARTNLSRKHLDTCWPLSSPTSVLRWHGPKHICATLPVAWKMNYMLP